MIIRSRNLFTGGVFRPGALDIQDGIITAVTYAPAPADVDLGDHYLLPGFVDIHTHGAMGEDFSDGSPEGLSVLSRYYARHGVTSFLATTMTLPEEVLTAAMAAIRDFSPPPGGARCAGIHLEGPFLCASRRGAQAEEHLHPPDTALFRRLQEASGGKIRLVTVAPEEPGAIPFIREISPICRVSLGHTAADYDTAMEALLAGATHVTHLFNAMPPLLHRAPGVIGAAADAGITAELICDGFHIHPSAIRAAWKLFPGRVAVISDSLRCAEMPDGIYRLGGQPIEVRGGRAFLQGSETIAGSSSNLLEELGNLVSYGIPLEEAVTAVTLVPARAAGLDREIGSLETGKRADLTVLDRNLQLVSVYLGGRAT